MSKQKTQLTKVEKFATKCKNKFLVDSYVNRYLQQTKSAVENLIAMSEIIYEMNSKVENAELSMNDLNYFCSSVGIDKKSSYFRKHVCIGKKADFLKKFINKIPSAVSTVYEITTVDADEIERLIEWNKLQPNTTLAELKSLVMKTTSNEKIKDKEINHIKIDFDYKKLSADVKLKIYDFYKSIKNNKELTVYFPLAKEFENQFSNVIDVEVKKLKYA